MNLSAVVLTKNEEENLRDCLESLKFCDEVIVIDDESKDKTVNIAKESGAKIFIRPLGGDFSAQRNLGLEKATNRWVLFVDADERVSQKLEEEILDEINRPGNPHVGYYMRRDDYLWGKKLKFGETANLLFLRLARKSGGKWERCVHEVWKVTGRTKTLNSPLLHYPHQTLREFIKDINFHSDLDVDAKKKEGKKSNLMKIIFWPRGKFINNWIFRLGFLDGNRGFMLALMMSFHSFLSWSKLWIYQKQRN